jgi:peptidoglycan/LPS O-acetylase OafA/YrhL
MQSKTTQHQYFPNLDGLRFIGSLTILLLHIENIKASHGIASISWVNKDNPLGELAVSLFFVLSGFLITYLLLKEQETSSTINIKGFYIKRILKIWPLYYFIGVVGFFLLPWFESFVDSSGGIKYHLWPDLFLYCLFLPTTSASQSMGATWSVRVEEAFYLLWPLLLLRFKNYFRVFACIMFFVIIGRCMLIFLLKHLHTYSPVLKILVYQAKDYRVSCMAIGGMGAYLYIKDIKRVLRVIYRKDLQWSVYLLTIALLILRVKIPYIQFEFYSVLFSFIVLNLATNPDSILKLDYKWINYLGKISYGVYLFNPIMRIFCLRVVRHIFGGDVVGLWANMALYSLTILSTMLVSIISYEYFEKYFLNMKGRFASI